MRCMNAGSNEFKVHGGFVFRPCRDFGGIDAKCVMFTRPAMDGCKAWVILGTIKNCPKGGSTFIQQVDGFEQVVGCDLPEGQFSFIAGTFDHLDEVYVVFPVPGKAEVVVHI